jgi:hypothetical protein
MIRLNPKAKWVEIYNPVPGLSGAWYKWGDLKVCVALEGGLWHISVSQPHRYPTWDEIYTAWYDLVPDASQINGAIILPRKSEYVNIHPNCFHVHQLRDAEVPAIVL